MSELLLFWIGAGIVFLIIEMITAAFYGLSLAIASFIVACYVWITWGVTVSIVQWLIFVIFSALTSYGLTRLFSDNTKETPQWLDIYLGQTRKVKKVGEDFKVSLDGVEYFVEIDGLKWWEKVKLTSRHGSIFHGEIV